jgi:hypothetical protein
MDDLVPMAQRCFCAAAIASLLAAAACGGGVDKGGGIPGQHYADVAAQIPPLAPGFGRIYFYRIYDPYGGSVAFMPIDVNGTQAAMSQPGTVSYKDFPANTYQVTVNTPGLYPSQNTNVYLAAGQTVYVLAQYNSDFSQGFNSGSPFLLSIVDPAQAQAQIQPLAYSAAQ